MLRHVVYKRNEKDFATRVVEDDATGVVTQYVGDAVVVTSTTDPVNGGIELSAGGVAIQVVTVIAMSAVPVTLTGTTAETTLATITIPAGIMGLNGRLRISWAASHTNSANNKIYKHKLSGTQLGGQITRTASDVENRVEVLANRNSQSSQFWATSWSTTSGTAASQATTTIDTSVETTYQLTAQLANAGETITLQSYMVELIK